MSLFPRSLLWRTFLVLAVAMALAQGTAFSLLNEYVTRPRVAAAIGQLVLHLKTVQAALQTMAPEQQPAFIARVAQLEGIRIAPVRGDEGMVPLGERPRLRTFRARLREQFGPDAEVYVRGEHAPGAETDPEKSARHFWVRLNAGPRAFWVAVPRGRIERETATAVITWGAVGVAIALVAAFLLMWRLNRPLEELARAAAAIGRGRKPEPVDETGPAEIRAVARAFNQMSEDLQKNERERATFLAGISHDLRTPLTRLRLDVEMLEEKVDPAVQRAMVADLEEMNAIIDQFIDFTRSESSEPAAPVDLAELARAAAERAARSGVQVRCDLEPVPSLRLRPLAMQRLVENLVGNAAKHAGGEVLIATRAQAGRVALSVLDRGPGIPAGMVERLKQPFTRLDEARSGSSGAGLGLAIADRIATLHGGRLELLPRDGGGLEARVTLPAASPGLH